MLAKARMVATALVAVAGVVTMESATPWRAAHAQEATRPQPDQDVSREAYEHGLHPSRPHIPADDSPAPLPDHSKANFVPNVCAGNLVPNGDFEIFSLCPNNIGQVAYAPPWFHPTLGSSDYFNACAGSGPATAGVPQNFYTTKFPNSGNGYMNFRLYGNVPPGTTTDYREYIEVPLTASLMAGQTYNVSFWVSRDGSGSNYAISNISAYFSAGPIYANHAVVLNVTPQVTNASGPVTIVSAWQQITGSFVAVGGENHMTIGNFKNDATTTAIYAASGCCPVASYCIDDVCVTGPPGTMLGSCCYQGASGLTCSVVTAAQCATLNGLFGGKGSNCSGSSCSSVFGACCLPAPGQNVCTIKTPSDCAAMGGTYLGNGTTCTPGDPCNPPTGACCYLPAGQTTSTCVVTTQTDCLNNYNGTYKGDNSSCSPDPCNPQGACCYSQGGSPTTCVITDQATCLGLYGGFYYGDNTICPPSPCDPAPHKGACCYQLPGTTITQCAITTSTGCNSYWNGVYYGDGSTCGSANCAMPATGACCFHHPDGTGPFCVVVDQQTCIVVLHGTFQGLGTPCNPDTCDPPPPTGACCYQNLPSSTWFCTITTQIDCLQNYPNSTYMGNGSPCTPNPCAPQFTGACCYLLADGTPGGCVVTTQQDCIDTFHGTYMGNSTTCTPNPCVPSGACCYQTATGPTCVVATAADCASIYNGQYQGDNVPCINPSPCAPTGACCYGVPPTCIITTQQACINVYMGTWFGANSTCNPNPCLPTGACCYQGAAGPQCIIVTQADCTNVYQGVWQGANVPCNPNPCIPTGACCYQKTQDSTYTCIITTQQICATLNNSTWQGPNTTCSPNPCPIVGACCYTPAGSTTTTCAMVMQGICLQTLHGIYMGNNVPCTPNPCPRCVKPPKGMMGWWTFDETAGGIAHDSAGGHHGAYKPTTATGPTPLPGMVDGSLGFDGVNDYVQVPNFAQLNFNCAPFSIDAWIFRQSGGVIVRKSTASAVGYEFFVNGGGQLGLGLGTTSSTCAAILSTGTVPLNVWTHVAVTASGGPPSRTVTFYINGAAAGSGGTSTCVCVGNSAAMIFGGPGNFASYLRGKLDEIEIFNRVLTPSEVLAIFNARDFGKCKARIHTTADFPFCLNQNQVTVPVTICNDSPFPFNFNVTFQPLNSCSIPGPTVFTPLFTNPVSIPANNCVTVQVKINRPIGMVAVNQVACYQVTATNTTLGVSYYGQGSVKDRRDLCAVIGPCCLTGVSVPVGVSKTLQYFLTNTSQVALTVPFTVKALDGDDQSGSAFISLNGLPPGTRYIGNLVMQPGASAAVSVEMRYLAHHELGFDDIVLSADVDGDGTFEPLTSITARSVIPLCEADIAPDDIGNGQVDIDDLVWVITHWGNCPQPCPPNCSGDANHNCKVDIDDLVLIITHWGACP